MYRINAIIDSWVGLNAWRQNYDPDGKQLEDDVTVGESGMYYQDEHPMLTLQNLTSVMPDYSLVNYPQWLIGTAYLKDAIIKDGGINYKAKRDNTGQTPSTSTDDWKVFNPFSEWIVEQTKAGIVDTVTTFLEIKELNKTAKTILENKTLFDGIGRIEDVVENEDKRVGFEIVASRSKGLTARMDKIGLQFDTDGDVTVQLHHSSKKEALETIVLAYTGSSSIQWFDLAWDLPNVSEDVDSGGSYYITYKQSLLSGKAIKKEKQWDSLPVNCEDTEVATWKIYSKHLEFHPFTVDEVPGDELWDIDKNGYDNTTNHGVNFSISLYCGHTEFLIEQRDLFKSVLRKQVAINLLRLLAYNPNSRISQDESTIDTARLLYEIDGDPRDDAGLKIGMYSKYRVAMRSIMMNTEGIHRLCLPCKRKGVKYRTT